MKKITLLLSFIACVGFMQAQFLVNENFDYAVTTPMVGTGDWAIVGTSTTNPLTVTASTITYAGYPSSGIGQELSVANTGQDITKAFTAQLTGTLYFSVLAKITAAGSVGDYFIHFVETGSTSAFFSRLYVKFDGAKIAFGILNASGGTYSPTYTASSYDLNTTYLLVVKVDVATAASSIIVNPVMTAEPTAGWVVNTTGGTSVPAAAKGIGGINIRQGSSSADTAPTLLLDGIHVATSWNALFGITGFSTPSANAFSATVVGKKLLVKNVANGSTVEIFSTLGAKVQSSELVNGSIEMNNLTKGLYIVRVGKNTQKIML
ncbi:MAG: T9SS type A sorting domain-containing protein [Paludibacter sp.]